MGEEMNLIEQLGGYEKAKEWVNKNSADLDWASLGEYRKDLLEYRREHGIFENGDWVINTKTKAVGDFVKYINLEKGHKHCLVDIGLCDLALFCVKNLKHATPEEIEAGRRLEVCGG